LNHFLHKQDIDFALLQEIAMSHPNGISRYNIYMNRGTDGRVTAILTKGLTATNILRLPTGRGMAADIHGTWIMNIYAPSGAEKRTEREQIFYSLCSCSNATGKPRHDTGGRF
jgi:hypothetical protein